MTTGGLGEVEAAHRDGWALLRQHADRLRSWTERPPDALDEVDARLLKVIAHLVVDAMWQPGEGRGDLDRLADEQTTVIARQLASEVRQRLDGSAGGG